jgi:hypothetical protein
VTHRWFGDRGCSMGARVPDLGRTPSPTRGERPRCQLLCVTSADATAARVACGHPPGTKQRRRPPTLTLRSAAQQLRTFTLDSRSKINQDPPAARSHPPPGNTPTPPTHSSDLGQHRHLTDPEAYRSPAYAAPTAWSRP